MSDKIHLVFKNDLDHELVKKFLTTTNLRRIDFNNIFTTTSQNIINRYRKLNLHNKYDISLWKSFLLDLIFYSIDNEIIDEETGDLLIYFKIDNRMLNKHSYTETLNLFHKQIDIESELNYNYYLLLLAILEHNKNEKDILNSYLEGKPELLNYVHSLQSRELDT